MLKLSWAMVGHAEAICQMLFGHVVGFVPQSALPRSSQILSGFWRVRFGELCWMHFGIKYKDQSNILGPDWGQVWPLWALLGYLQLLLAAKLGDLQGKLGYREVMLKLCWAMLCHVEARLYVRLCSAMSLLLHPEMSPPPGRTKILSGFLRAMLGPFGGRVRLFCGYVGTVGTILGPASAI